MATALDAGKRRLAPEPAETPWHALAIDDVLERLGAGRHGLPGDEARRRLERHGPNSLPQAPGRNPVLRFLAQFHSALIYFLLAAAAGDVVYSGAGLIGYGELVIIKHSDEFLSAYGHNRKRLVAEGQRVSAGQQIAEMGRSGAARDMLHFEIRRNGKPIDPLPLLPKR